MKVIEVESLRPTLAPQVSIGGVRGTAIHWRDHVGVMGETRIDAQFDDAWPAVVSHANVRYVAAWLPHALHREVLQQAAKDAGIETQLLPDGLRIRRRGDLTFAFNFGNQEVEATKSEKVDFILGQAHLATGEICIWKNKDGIN